MAKNVILLLIRRGLGALISMVSTMIIIKSLSVGDYGVYSIFLNTVAMVSTFGTFGVEAAASFVLQNNRYEHRSALINFFASAMVMMIGTAIFSVLLFYNLSISDLDLIPYDLKIYLVLATVSVLFCNIMFALTLGNMDFTDYAIFSMIPNVLLLVLLYLFKYFVGPLTLEQSVIFYTAGFVFAGVLVGIYQFFKYRLYKKINSIKAEIIKYIYYYGLRSYFSNVITFLNYRINIFIIGFYLGVKDVGIYSTCLVLIDFVWLLSSTLASITYPLFSNPANIGLRKKILPVITRSVILITFLISLGFYLFSDFLIPLLFGDKFLQVKTIFLIVSPGVILMAGTKILANDFAAQGKPQINIYLNLLTLIVTVAANFLLIPLLGIKGAALATTIAFSTFFTASLIYYCKLTNTHFMSYLAPRWDDFRIIMKAKN